MKKTLLLTMILGLFLMVGTVAKAHNRDVGYSPPQIEKVHVIMNVSAPADQIISSLPVSPDVGSGVTQAYSNDYRGYITPTKVAYQLRPERSRHSIYNYKYRRSTEMGHNYTRPPDSPPLE